MNRLLPDDPPKVASLDIIPPHLTTAVDDLIAQLDRSVKLRSWVLLVVLQRLEGLGEIAASKAVMLRTSTGVEVKVLLEEC